MVDDNGLSMETIDYQNDKIFKELTELYRNAAMVMDNDWKKERSEYQDKLAKVINDGFGFGAKMALGELQPSILFYDSDPNHILVEDRRADINLTRFVERYIAANTPGGPKPGYVDIRKAKVS